MKGRDAHEYFQQIHCRPQRESAAPGGGDDHTDLPQLRAKLHLFHTAAALAEILPVLQDKAQKVKSRGDVKKVPFIKNTVISTP